MRGIRIWTETWILNSWKGKKENDSKKGKDSSNITAEGEEFAFTTTFAGATLAHSRSPLAKLEIDVYDSGASSHRSPAHKCFILLTQIPACTIKATDQTLFTATAMGKLQVSISNEKGLKKITLREVLYCPDLAFTLVSLSQCDMAEYFALLKDCKCTISDLKGTLVGRVPLIGSLYKHIYTPEMPKLANAAHATQMIDELHQCMGHISPFSIRELVKNEVITGLTLDPKSEASFCSACVKAKPTCKPIPKQQTSPLAPNLGDKVHLDM